MSEEKLEKEKLEEKKVVEEKKEEIKIEKIEEKKKKKISCPFRSAWMPLIFGLFFAVVFYFFSYDLVGIKYSDITDPRVTDLFTKYTVYAGLAMGFISMIGAYILHFILKKLKLMKYSLSYPVLAWLMLLPWYLFARELVYFENEYTNIARGLINYIGDPLLSTTKFLAALVLVRFFLLTLAGILKKTFSKKAGTVAVILFLPILLSGCVGTLNEWACSFFDDPDHCFQNAAVQDADPDVCEKIKGGDFENSNPPKDKCYKMIAENTGDLSVCDEMEGGMYSYTKEECILSTSIKFENPSGCMSLTGADKEDCIAEVSKGLFPGGVIDMDEQIGFLEKELEGKEDSELQEQLDDLKKRRGDYLEVMTEDRKKSYESLSDPMNKRASLEEYRGEIDEKTKKSMIALNDSLREKGEKLTDKEYETISKTLAYKNDPKNDIENMDDAEIVKLRWNEKLGNISEKLKFWKANKTAEEKKYDEQLFFYKRMLERQAAIDKGYSQQQQDFNREADRVKDYVKDEVINKVTDEVKKAAFGELLDLVDSSAAGPTTTILGEALNVVIEEAEGAEFRGLVRAYDRGMEEELAGAGGDIEKAHAAVVANLQGENPNMYDHGAGFAKYTNLLENKDCDGSNPHCINREVFWKSMKKSYKYQNK